MTEPDDGARQQATEQMTEAILAGRKIDAIKLYRQRMNCDLAEAKVQVEALTAELKARHPDLFPSRTPSGCFGAVLFTLGTLLSGGLMTVFLFRG